MRLLSLQVMESDTLPFILRPFLGIHDHKNFLLNMDGGRSVEARLPAPQWPEGRRW